MQAQYSIPFCVALALYREARNPESFDETALADPAIRALARKVRLVRDDAPGSLVTVTLNDGRRLARRETGGMLEPDGLPDKFRRLCRGALGEAEAARLYDRLQGLEDEADLAWLGATPPPAPG